MTILNKIVFNSFFSVLSVKNTIKNLYVLFVLCFTSIQLGGQAPLFEGVSVSDIGISNNIGDANSSRNIAVSDTGTIYVAYTGSLGVRIAKSTNRGQDFLASVEVSTVNIEPEIIVNALGFVFVSWAEGGNLMLSRSIDEGETFSNPIVIGPGNFTTHMATFENSIYLIDKTGEYIYSNSNNGEGLFSGTRFSRRVFADIWTDQNGIVYVPSDDPKLSLLRSLDSGVSFSSRGLSPSRNVFFSSYALSDGPCGTFIFVGGGGATNSITGYKVDVSTGISTIINLGENFNFQGRTLFADDTGTIIDGYQNNSGELMIRVSGNQGTTFDTPIAVALGNSHNITKNPVNNDVVVAYEQNGQVFVSVYNNLLKGVSVIETTRPLITCKDRTFDLPYALSGTFAPDTMFTVYLSDDTGNFENETLIATVTSNTSGTITCNLPNDILASDNYRVQIKSLIDCTQSKAVLLEIINPSTASVSSMSPICLGADAVFTIIGTPNSDVYYSGVVSTSANPVVLDASGKATISVVSPTSDQTITLDSVNDSRGVCSTVLTESSTVVINPLPAVNLEEQYIICVDVNGTEVLNPPIIDTFLNVTDYSFEWYLEGDVLSQFNNQSAINPIVAGLYSVEVTDKITNCTATIKSTIVYESSPPIITPRIVSSAFSNPHIIEVEADNSADNNPISEFEFSINNNPWELGFGSPGSTYTFTFEDHILIGTNIIRVRDVLGCGENEVEFIVMDYPRFFTPNNDGANDRWNIVAPTTPINYLATAQIYIFNRYGKLLKQISPSGLGWDGVFNGQVLPNDDYWFVVNFIDPLDNETKQFKAHFALKR